MTNILTKLIGDKKRYKKFKQEVAALPAPYRNGFEALEKYMWNFAKGEGFMDALEAVLHMFQEGAGENIPVSNIVGDDPVEFAADIMDQYPEDLWLTTRQNKLRDTFKKLGD